MDRLPTKDELFDMVVMGFAVMGQPLSVERQLELRGIVDREAEGILAWALRGVPPARRAAYLRVAALRPVPRAAGIQDAIKETVSKKFSASPQRAWAVWKNGRARSTPSGFAFLFSRLGERKEKLGD